MLTMTRTRPSQGRVPARDANRAHTTVTSRSDLAFSRTASTVRMGVADEALVLSMLSAISANPATYVLREMWSNAIDAERRAHVLDADHRIEVSIRTNATDEGGIAWRMLAMEAQVADDVSTLSVTDHGCGMTAGELERNFLQYGGSDKRDDVDAIGSKGLGAKAPLAIADGFSVETTRDGVTTYAVVTRPGGGVPEASIAEYATGAPSGTTVTVPFADPSGALACEMRAYAESLSAYLTVPYLTLNGTEMPAGLADKVAAGDWVVWDAADGIRVFEDVSSAQVLNQNPRSTSTHVPGLSYRTPNLDDSYHGSRSHNLSDVSVVIEGERYRLPHFASSEHDTCIVEVAPGFLDFDPSRDGIVNNGHTRDFERWLQATIFDHLLEDDNVGDTVRLGRAVEAWHESVTSVKRTSGSWAVTVTRQAEQTHPGTASSYVPMKKRTVTLHLPLEGSPASEALPIAWWLSHASAYHVTCDGRQSHMGLAGASSYDSRTTRAAMRAQARAVNAPDVPSDQGRTSPDLRMGQLMSRLMRSQTVGLPSRHVLCFGDEDEHVGIEAKSSEICLVSGSELLDVMRERPSKLDAYLVSDGAAAFLRQLFAGHVTDATTIHDLVSERRSLRLERARARRAAQRSDTGRQTEAVAPARPPRLTPLERRHQLFGNRYSSDQVAVAYDDDFDDATPVILVACRMGDMGSGYDARRSLARAADALQRFVGALRDEHVATVVCALPVDDLADLSGAEGVTLLEARGFADRTMERLGGWPRCDLAGLVRCDVTYRPTLTLDTPALVERFGLDRVRLAVTLVGLSMLSCANWLIGALGLDPTLALPAWAAPVDTIVRRLRADGTRFVSADRNVHVVCEGGVASIDRYLALVSASNRRYATLDESQLISAFVRRHGASSDGSVPTWLHDLLMTMVSSLLDVEGDLDRE